MKHILLPASVLLAAAWIAYAQQTPVVRDVRPITDVRVGTVDSEARGDNDKWTRVVFERAFAATPVVTATVCDMKEPGEHNGVFAVILKDVTVEGFRFKVQEADTKLAWSDDLRLHWIAVVEER